MTVVHDYLQIEAKIFTFCHTFLLGINFIGKRCHTFKYNIIRRLEWRRAPTYTYQSGGMGFPPRF